MSQTQYIIADSRKLEEIFKKKKLGKPDLVLTSPPYFDVKNYENRRKQLGFGQSYAKYVNDIINIFQKCYDISSKNATFWLVMDSIRRDGKLIPLPFELIDKLNENHKKTWILRDIIIWNKYKNVPWYHKGIFKNHFEYILFLSKNDDYKFHIDRVREVADLKKWWISYPERYNPKGKVPTNIWEFTSPLRGWGNGCQRHFCPFPFQLVEKILSISTDPGDLVFDPFVGSGAVLAVSKVMGRDSIGIDINRKYKRRFESEVIIGVEKYWKRRKIELKKIKDHIDIFKELNAKLRKMKLCGNIVTDLLSQDFSTGYNRYFCVSNENSSELRMKMIVVSNTKNKNSQFKINQFVDDDLRNLSRMFKVEVEMKFMNLNELLSQNPNILKYFEYDPKKTNHYEREIELENIDFDKLVGNKIYSNMCLNITKTKEFFSKL